MEGITTNKIALVTIVISESRNEAIFDLVADGLDMATEARFE